MTEHELVERAKAGDTAALTELINTYSERVYNLAMRILRNREEAEDILQETFLTVVEKLHTFDGRSSFFTWIYRIATNASLMRLRKKKPVFTELNNDPDFHDNMEDRVFVDWTHDPSMDIQQKELKKILDAAIDELSDIYRTVFVLRDIENLSIKETSKILDISERNLYRKLKEYQLR